MLDTILSVVAVLLVLVSSYAVVMCVWVAVQTSKAEKEFWETRKERRKEVSYAGQNH